MKLYKRRGNRYVPIRAADVLAFLQQRPSVRRYLEWYGWVSPERAALLVDDAVAAAGDVNRLEAVLHDLMTDAGAER